MPDINFLEVAQHLLQNVTGSTPAEETIGAAQVSQAAALIAIAERMDTQNKHLEYLRGHLNVAASSQTAIAERMDKLIAQQSVLFEYIVKRDQEFLKVGLVAQ